MFNLLGMDMSELDSRVKRKYVRKKLTPRQMKLARSSRAKAGIRNRAAGVIKQTKNTIDRKKDRMLSAKAPGWRTSGKTGKLYFEKRQNRSDSVGKNI